MRPSGPTLGASAEAAPQAHARAPPRHHPPPFPASSTKVTAEHRTEPWAPASSWDLGRRGYPLKQSQKQSEPLPPGLRTYYTMPVRRLRAVGKDKTIIVYSGPTSLVTQLYLDNFEYFLKHGLPSSRHGCRLHFAVILVLTSTVLDRYADSIAHYNASCGEIQTLTREDRCYDMESARIALASRPDFNKLVFLNCGLSGPFRSAQNLQFWASEITARLSANVKLTGITINCGGKLNVSHAHVQSMLWATDRIGIASIVKAGAIYDCGDQLSEAHGRSNLIVRYELGLSRAVLKSGYAIQDQTNRTFTWDSALSAKCPDLWNDPQLVSKISPERLIFWKVSRPMQAVALSRWQNRTVRAKSARARPPLTPAS